MAFDSDPLLCGLEPHLATRILRDRLDRLVDLLPPAALAEYRMLDAGLRVAREAMYARSVAPPALARMVEGLVASSLVAGER